MMVSMAMAVLPVCLSPMMSSRWPRPMGTRLSTALMPVSMGSFTEIRGMMPGALTPTRALPLHATGPLPSMGLPRASTTRPRSSGPTGTSTIAPVRLTMSPSLMSLSLPKTTIPTLSGSRLSAMPLRPLENSTISSAWMFFRPYTRAIPSPMERTRPVSSRLEVVVWPRMRSSKMDETSAEPAPAYRRFEVDRERTATELTPMHLVGYLVTVRAICLARAPVILAETKAPRRHCSRFSAPGKHRDGLRFSQNHGRPSQADRPHGHQVPNQMHWGKFGRRALPIHLEPPVRRRRLGRGFVHLRRTHPRPDHDFQPRGNRPRPLHRRRYRPRVRPEEHPGRGDGGILQRPQGHGAQPRARQCGYRGLR
uniref:Putative secreted protein n=1 Tax=Ixodes ricinus TaxID=34613 RepID=A0A6B0VAQ7_IXORI